MSRQRSAGSAVAAVLAVGYLALVIVRAFGSDGGGWTEVLAFLPILVGSVLLGLLLIAWYSHFSRARLRRLVADHPNAVVFTAELTPELKVYVETKQGAASNQHRVGVPHFHTVVASVEGISLWGGPPARPAEFLRVEWAAISDIRRE